MCFFGFFFIYDICISKVVHLIILKCLYFYKIIGGNVERKLIRLTYPKKKSLLKSINIRRMVHRRKCYKKKQNVEIDK